MAKRKLTNQQYDLLDTVENMIFKNIQELHDEYELIDKWMVAIIKERVSNGIKKVIYDTENDL